MGSSDGFAPDMQDYYNYDPAKAKALLTAAGYPHGFTFNITSESIIGTLADPVLDTIAQEYSAIGVTIEDHHYGHVADMDQPVLQRQVRSGRVRRHVFSSFIRVVHDSSPPRGWGTRARLGLTPFLTTWRKRRRPPRTRPRTGGR